MLQDIFPLHLDNHFDPDKKVGEDDYVIVFKGDISNREAILKADEESIVFPRLSDFQGIDRNKLVYIFNIGDDNFFLLDKEADEDVKVSEAFSFNKIRELRRVDKKLSTTCLHCIPLSISMSGT